MESQSILARVNCLFARFIERNSLVSRRGSAARDLAMNLTRCFLSFTSRCWTMCIRQ